jgi:DNA-binding CsgD family transcriptional regulator
LGVSLPNNAFLVAAGLQMTSVWHYAGLDPDVRMVLSCEDASAYFFGYAPVQMKIVDRREVLLDGPRLRGEPTVIAVRDTACMDAARDYWSAVTTTTYPCVAEAASLDDFSPRQRHVVALMLVSTTDEEIAGRLGVSLRTVRTEIATVLRLLEAPTRFVAGTRLRERLGVQAPTHDG